MSVRIGTAGWSIPREDASRFAGEGTALARYGRVLDCVEINSSFYRPHRPSTYERWAASVPDDFRFSVKAPKVVTHECGLAPAPAQVRAFLEEVSRLGTKLGPILVQLPPRQGFQQQVAHRFLGLVRGQYPTGEVVLEPRNAGWFTAEAEALLQEFRIARVAADPPPLPAAAWPAGDPALVYVRWHGSPRMYYSRYTRAQVEDLAERLREHAANGSAVWCIFDNTALGAALTNALELKHCLAGTSPEQSTKP